MSTSPLLSSADPRGTRRCLGLQRVTRSRRRRGPVRSDNHRRGQRDDRAVRHLVRPSRWVVDRSAADSRGREQHHDVLARCRPTGTRRLHAHRYHDGAWGRRGWPVLTAAVLSATIVPGVGFNRLSGTMTITSSSDASVEGEFSFQARHADDPASLVTISGTFRSRNEVV